LEASPLVRQIVECVANFSEGRHNTIIDEIVSAISAVSGVYVLDRESDPDHNRSVITFIAAPQTIVEAAFQGIAAAARLIDMDEHCGEHPRLGATDVVPFIPIEGVDMNDCVLLARRLGEQVGRELNIPVYLYESAATRPDRENLEDVRRGQYEALKEAIGKDPDRAPDFGPSSVGKAGATIIGARAPLVAYNVYLTTSDVEIAKQISKAIRHSSGGYRYVKGLGLLVDGKAQVSMNLTDYSRTPIHRVVETIRREAARNGVGIQRSEIVGLVPQRALLDAAQWYLQIDDLKPEQILENRLSDALQAGGASLNATFLDELAAGTATPGGGSAAAYAAAMGAALCAMVARLTVGKKKYADVEARMNEIIIEADRLRADLAEGVQRDAAAFNEVMTALRLPKETDEQQTTRTAAIESATHHAAEVPLEATRLAVRVVELAAELAETGNSNAISDCGSAGALAGAGLHAAGLNVRINAAHIQDQDAARRWQDALSKLEERARRASQRLDTAIQERGRITISV
jgi:glutamate formiminotransferase/formiminotetrahydrofolate cyclodeaminase